MRKTWNRIVSVVMALAMVVLCLPGYSNPVKTAKAAAAGVSYIDASGETKTYTGTYRSIRGGGNANTYRPTTWTSGWYVVEPYNNPGSGNEISIGSRVTLSANSTVNLILKDGVKLKVTSGITVPKGCTLNIYAQSTGSDMGQLYTGSNNVARNNAGIGGTGSGAGAITINGGKITAYGGLNGAGIGGGYGNGGAVTINGGAVNAYGGSSGGAGIGGGRYGNGGTITINGGVVNAYGGSAYGAGVGGGYHGYGGTISISGNNTVVNATGGSYAAGIGGGCSYDEDTVVSQHITISGGKITAIGGTGAAGIGSGESQTVGTISISGGTVNATAGGYDTYVMTEYFTAAIGGTFGSADKITISGGSITTHLPSENDRYCTGIGSIYGSDNANVEITGGVVVANGTTGRYAGIGIGTGVSALGGKVSISITDNNTSVTANSYGGTITLVTPVTDVTSDPNVNLPAGVVSNHNQINGKKLVKGTSYTIQFVNSDSDHTPLQDPIEVTPGTHPKYSGATPTLPTTAQYTYTFSGWKDENNQTYGKDEELPAANGSMTYTATYTATVNEYTVKFVKEDGSEISSETYPYNTAADNIAVPTAPEKDPSTEETFEFKGWLNTTTNAIGVVAVTGDVTYKATYTGFPRKYTVTFVDENGVNIIDPVEYEYNTAANAITVPTAPEKDPSTEETFEFKGWLNTTTNALGVVAVTGDVTYKATYTGSPRKYTVTFKDANGNNIIDPAQYDYNTPADEITVPADPFKDADDEFVYTFSGWSPAITAVTGDATYVATYSTSPRQYSDLEVKVVWDDNGDCDGFRPDSVTVTLLGNEETVSTKTLSGDTWTDTFHVPTNDVKGNPITYTIEAPGFDNYEKTVNGFTVTYKHTPETTEASVKVVWVDSNDEFSTRPNDLEVYLSDGEEVTLSSINSWTATINGLLKHENQGEVINYTWPKFSVPGYELTDTTTEGTTTTFTFTLITTTVSGEVLWELKDNSDDLLPDDVTVYIKDGDTTVDTITVTANTVGEWTFTSIVLPKYRSNGTGTTEISYTVSEAAVPRFATTISGTEITNTLNTCDVTVSINWDDADDQDGYRPNSDGVEVTLIGDSVEVDTIVLNAENGWTHTWADVPKEADINTDIQYTVEGATVSEYTFEGSTLVDDDDPRNIVLNYQHTPETTGVQVTVVWNDANNQDGYHPNDVTINLFSGGEQIDTVTLNEGDSWSKTWTGLDKKISGNSIMYTVTVEEDNLSEYTVAIDKVEGDDFKYTVTLNHEIEKTNVKVSKVWDDADDQDGYRPYDVTIRLLADGDEKEAVTLNEENNWTYTWSDLDKKADGNGIDYTVTEDGVENYNAQITKATDGTFTYTVTNTHKPEETEVKVSKVWNDADDQDGYRPDDVTINLLVNGSPEEYVTLNEDNNWTYTWTKLPKKADGFDIDYTVTEDEVAEYSTNIVKAEDGTFTYTVTNTHETEETEVSVTKVWEDADDQDGYRPNEVTINLLSDGEVIDTVKLNEQNDWSYHWTKLPKKAAGSDIDYTVSEDEVAEYTANIVKATDGTFTYTVTNKHTTEEVEVTVSKVWEDSNDKEGFRPEGVTVHLYKGTEVIDSAILGINNHWTYTWSGLAKNDNGVAIDYKVTEDPVANYSTEITKATDGTFTYTVTNSRDYEETEASVSVVWDDNDNEEGFRPDSVTVNLMKGNAVLESVELNEGNGWSHSWTKLQKYENGEAVNYTVTEDSVDNYSTLITKADGTFTYTVTNSRSIEKTQVSVEKIWDDSDNKEGFRPESVTVKLLANDAEAGTATLNKENEWKYTWDDLNKFAGGQEITYTVSEAQLANYDTPVIEKVSETAWAYTVTNSRDYEETEVKFSIVWNDANDQDGYRPANVTVRLLADGESTADSFVLDSSNWNGTFDHLQKIANATEINYTISVDNISEYTTKIEQAADGTFTYTVTYSHTIEQTEVSVSKVWSDADDQDGYRPDDVTVNLLADGKIIDTVTLSEENEWSYSWTKLDKKANGADIDYTVTEDEVSEYTTKIEKATDGSFTYTVTNTHTPETVSPSVKVVWDDDDNNNGYRPEDVSFTLTDASGNGHGTVTLSSNNTWEATVPEPVDKYENHGTEVEYAWDIAFGLPEGYSEIGRTTVGKLTTITIKYDPKPAKLPLEVEKILIGRNWNEADEFEFTLAADENNKAGAELPEVTTIIVTKDKPSVAFEDITFTKIGTFTFTISEVEGEQSGIGYDTEQKTVTVEINDLGGFLCITDITDAGRVSITNVYESKGNIQITANKVLNGRDLTDGEFSFELIYDGNVIQTKSCTKDGKVAFDAIAYSEEDMVVEGEIVTTRDYTYTIREVIPDSKDPKIVYDEQEIKIVVTLTDNQDGTITATADKTEGITFTNVKLPEEYTIKFVDEDGTILKTATYTEGTKAADIEKPADPTKASDGKYDYTFDSWTPAIADVTEDATYTATYKATEIKGVYKYIGEAAKYTKGSKKAVTIIFKRTENDEITFDMFAGVKTAKGNLVSGTHYTAKKGSVEITLLPDYLETLEVGKTAITVSFQDGDPVTIELEVAPAQQQADTNPTTGDSLNMNYIWIICVIGATALAVLIFVQVQRRRREEEF